MKYLIILFATLYSIHIQSSFDPRQRDLTDSSKQFSQYQPTRQLADHLRHDPFDDFEQNYGPKSPFARRPFSQPTPATPAKTPVPALLPPSPLILPTAAVAQSIPSAKKSPVQTPRAPSMNDFDLLDTDKERTTSSNFLLAEILRRNPKALIPNQEQMQSKIAVFRSYFNTNYLGIEQYDPFSFGIHMPLIKLYFDYRNAEYPTSAQELETQYPDLQEFIRNLYGSKLSEFPDQQLSGEKDLFNIWKQRNKIPTRAELEYHLASPHMKAVLTACSVLPTAINPFTPKQKPA